MPIFNNIQAYLKQLQNDAAALEHLIKSGSEASAADRDKLSRARDLSSLLNLLVHNLEVALKATAEQKIAPAVIEPQAAAAAVEHQATIVSTYRAAVAKLAKQQLLAEQTHIATATFDLLHSRPARPQFADSQATYAQIEAEREEQEKYEKILKEWTDQRQKIGDHSEALTAFDQQHPMPVRPSTPIEAQLQAQQKKQKEYEATLKEWEQTWGKQRQEIIGSVTAEPISPEIRRWDAVMERTVALLKAAALEAKAGKKAQSEEKKKSQAVQLDLDTLLGTIREQIALLKKAAIDTNPDDTALLDTITDDLVCIDGMCVLTQKRYADYLVTREAKDARLNVDDVLVVDGYVFDVEALLTHIQAQRVAGTPFLTEAPLEAHAKKIGLADREAAEAVGIDSYRDFAKFVNPATQALFSPRACKTIIEKACSLYRLGKKFTLGGEPQMVLSTHIPFLLHVEAMGELEEHDSKNPDINTDVPFVAALCAVAEWKLLTADELEQVRTLFYARKLPPALLSTLAGMIEPGFITTTTITRDPAMALRLLKRILQFKADLDPMESRPAQEFISKYLAAKDQTQIYIVAFLDDARAELKEHGRSGYHGLDEKTEVPFVAALHVAHNLSLFTADEQQQIRELFYENKLPEDLLYDLAGMIEPALIPSARATRDNVMAVSVLRRILQFRQQLKSIHHYIFRNPETLDPQEFVDALLVKVDPPPLCPTTDDEYITKLIANFKYMQAMTLEDLIALMSKTNADNLKKQLMWAYLTKVLLKHKSSEEEQNNSLLQRVPITTPSGVERNLANLSVVEYQRFLQSVVTLKGRYPYSNFLCQDTFDVIMQNPQDTEIAPTFIQYLNQNQYLFLIKVMSALALRLQGMDNRKLSTAIFQNILCFRSIDGLSPSIGYLNEFICGCLVVIDDATQQLRPTTAREFVTLFIQLQNSTIVQNRAALIAIVNTVAAAELQAELLQGLAAKVLRGTDIRLSEAEQKDLSSLTLEMHSQLISSLARLKYSGILNRSTYSLIINNLQDPLIVNELVELYAFVKAGGITEAVFESVMDTLMRKLQALSPCHVSHEVFQYIRLQHAELNFLFLQTIHSDLFPKFLDSCVMLQDRSASVVQLCPPKAKVELITATLKSSALATSKQLLQGLMNSMLQNPDLVVNVGGYGRDDSGPRTVVIRAAEADRKYLSSLSTAQYGEFLTKLAKLKDAGILMQSTYDVVMQNPDDATIPDTLITLINFFNVREYKYNGSFNCFVSSIVKKAQLAENHSSNSAVFRNVARFESVVMGMGIENAGPFVSNCLVTTNRNTGQLRPTTDEELVAELIKTRATQAWIKHSAILGRLVGCIQSAELKAQLTQVYLAELFLNPAGIRLSEQQQKTLEALSPQERSTLLSMLVVLDKGYRELNQSTFEMALQNCRQTPDNFMQLDHTYRNHLEFGRMTSGSSHSDLKSIPVARCDLLLSHYGRQLYTYDEKLIPFEDIQHLDMAKLRFLYTSAGIIALRAKAVTPEQIRELKLQDLKQVIYAANAKAQKVAADAKEVVQESKAAKEAKSEKATPENVEAQELAMGKEEIIELMHLYHSLTAKEANWSCNKRKVAVINAIKNAPSIAAIHAILMNQAELLTFGKVEKHKLAGEVLSKEYAYTTATYDTPEDTQDREPQNFLDELMQALSHLVTVYACEEKVAEEVKAKGDHKAAAEKKEEPSSNAPLSVPVARRPF